LHFLKKRADHADQFHVASCARNGAKEDDGFTILEVVVALALILFIMSALSPLFYTSIKTALLSNARSQATAIATKELETMRVSPYAEVGFYKNQAGWSANCDPTDNSLETVTLGDIAPADAVYTPTGTITVPGSSTVFNYTKCIAWVDAKSATGTTLTQAYKKTYVTVTWSNQGKTSTIKQQSIVYPGPKNTGGGVIVPTTPTAPSTPINVAATVPGDPTGRTQIDVTWQNGGGTVDHYVLEWSTNSAFTAIVGTSGSITSAAHSAGGLSSDTTYYFRVKAFGDSGTTYGSSYTTPVSAKTLVTPPSAICTVGNLGLVMGSGSTTKTYLSETTDLLLEEATFSSTFSTACAAGFTVRAFDSGSTQVSTTWSFPASGSARDVTTAWKNTKTLSQGVYTFTIYNGSVSTGQSHTLLVCKYKKNQSSDESKC
jgi:prepilin-type N-terminal cleavage/methylation domain-containing protein